MSKKCNIHVVAGKLCNPYLLDMFQMFDTNHKVTIKVLENDIIMNHYRSNAQIEVFPIIPEMPEYMRGLEKSLESADIIFAFNNHSLSTFQSVRAAAKHNIPIITMNTHNKLFLFEDAPNIRAMQTDINNNSDLMISYSNETRESLLGEGVSKDRTITLLPFVDTEKFYFDENKRRKFRSHIGINSDDKVVIVNDILEIDYERELFNLISSMRILRQRKPSFLNSLKVILTGTHGNTEIVKNIIIDYGLSKNFLFLHQNTTPFLHDLLCCCDIVINCKPTGTCNLEDQLFTLAAVACGATPIAPSGYEITKFLNRYVTEYSANSAESLALAMEPILEQDKNIHKDNLQTFIKEQLSTKKCGEILSEIILNVIGKKEKLIHETSYENRLHKISEYLLCRNFDSGLVLIEELLLHYNNSSLIMSNLYNLKGEFFLQMHKLNESMECFAQSNEIDVNPISLKGLGRIAFLNHADEESLRFYKHALSFNQNDSDVLHSIGLIYKRVGLNNEAIYWLSKSLSFNSNSVKLLIALTQACIECGNPQYSIDILEKTREISGDHPSLLMALGKLHIKAGNTSYGCKIINSIINPPEK